MNHAKIAMRPYSSIDRKSNLSSKAFQAHNVHVPNGPSMFTRDHLEPISTPKATKRTMEILDAEYEKENLPEIANGAGRHVSLLEQKQLLRCWKPTQRVHLGDSIVEDSQ